jgi:hypothetical protein
MQMAARAKKEAIAAYDQGDLTTTSQRVAMAMDYMVGTPTSAAVASEIAEIAKLQRDLAEGHGTVFRKRSSHQAYDKKSGKGSY